VSDKLLFDRIDEPGLNTLEVYQRRGGYESLRKALAMPPEAVLHELEASGLRGRGGAGFQMGKKVSFLPKGGMDKYLVCNADESEPGTFKDRELMQKSPHMLLEGIVIAAHAAGATRSFIYIRGEYVLQADILDAALAEARAAGFVGERILGSDTSLSMVVHRGRRLHLRRGDRPARLAGGQARQPAPEAAVPGQPGPLPGADVDQQRRDALHRALDHAHGRG
jgi:NADH-quinone oxidoreductase subunit F